MSEKQPLVLLHGVSGSASMWRRVVPLLQAQHEVFAPTALGHRGGALATLRPVRFEHVVDDLMRLLDARGLDRAHLAGNSLGGWAALELARRGRALSVCALSPAGMWDANDRDHRGAQRRLRRALLELPCPVTLAWCELDRILPLRTTGQTARALLPSARFLVLPDVGHVPMLDDAQLVADTILASTRAV